MKKTLAYSFLFLLPALAFSADSKVNWKLEKSELTYTVTHPLHVVHGTSMAARGEGLRNPDGTWQFLVAVPVQSFDSGDSNRDLHMQEVTRSGLYPLIKVTAVVAKLAEGEAPQTITADVDIEFAGKKAHDPGQVLEVLEWKPGEVHLQGIIILSLKAFNITPPSLLAMPVQDAVPVKLDMFWKMADLK